MGIEELNFSSAVLQGSAFAALADLVADLAGQKDASNTVGLTYTELQNLVSSFGFETMAKLGRSGKVDASGEFFWALPLDEVQKLNVPVVIGTDIVTAALADKDKNLPSDDHHFIAGLAKGYVDISENKVTGGFPIDDQGVAISSKANMKFPQGTELNAIDWFDLSAVVKAKNIRFDNNSETTDVSAIFSLFHEIDNAKFGQSAKVNATENSFSGDRLNEGKGTPSHNNPAISVDASYNERDRDYLNFLNLMTPTPKWEDLSKCGVATMAPYLEAGLYKHIVGYGLNKEYLTTASALRAVIRNNVRGTNTDFGANLAPEFEIMKAYGFPKNKVYEAYNKELAFGVVGAAGGTIGNERTNISNPSAADYGANAPKNTPAHIQAQFTGVFGSSGGLADQLNDFDQDKVFNDTDGITLLNVKAASDVTSWVEYINKVNDFINMDNDYHWSETGIAGPINQVGSRKEVWDNFQEVLSVDPRLAHLPNLALDAEQDKRLRILLETITNTDASATSTELDKDLSFSSYAANDITLAIAKDLSDAPVYIEDGEFYSANNKTKIANTQSIWAAAVQHGWSDATEVYGNLKGSGLFMIDSVYNVRSRIPKLDEQNANAKLNQAVRDQWKDTSTSRTLLRKNKTSLALNGARYAYEYFTPGHFQDAFFDMNDLQHTANVALRYFDLDTSSSSVDDVSRNILNIDSVIDYKLPLQTLDTAANSTPSGYSDAKQKSRVAWVYNKLVRPAFNTTKAALTEITSWSPVPPQLYVDVSDVTGYTKPSTLVTNASAAGDYNYDTAQADYVNRSLAGNMVHVMANYLAKATSASDGTKFNKNKEADMIALLDLHPAETLRAFNKMASNIDTTSATAVFTIDRSITASQNLSSNSINSVMIERILQALVHYGKPPAHFAAIGANCHMAVNAYEDEVKSWASDMGNSMGVFGDDADVFSMVQHLGYWVPYLSQYSPEELAEEVASDDDIQNISDQARALMLGLLLAATRGTLSSGRPQDAAARIAGLNAFRNAGIAPMLCDIAYTQKGINVFANLTGSSFGQ